MKSILLSFVIFMLLLGTVSVAGFIYVVEPGPEGRIGFLKATGRLLLYKYALIDSLKPREIRRLYESSCTRKCHGKAVIEDKPRTAMEWGQIVERMGAGDRADLAFNEKKTIIEHLQRNYLSNVPTILPDHTMRFLKKHLWRLDFGESDLYFDIIYMPLKHRRFMPYLALKAQPTNGDEAVFIVYVNTHTGIIPSWDMSRITTITNGEGRETKAVGWQILFEDVDKHHRQGILTFPEIGKEGDALTLTIKPEGMKERIFQWTLPVPDYVEAGK
ncbi:MAG: hypothetical protein A3G18_00145 [Rhodospirillales bacterium RIFCSPLOWO2_12_FULL_58_28]|nr:MAG: hypothetical protein A3H92_02755 [Rhodospirillales bacterium RIFCSPLOWO2_02_FULL_58_16]OHC79878.1 MAG: hypothetical protein A3G18_00145 [Rhodospirillales bacterium RIFCSPLOWO2_12_FULL_58_28]